MVAVNQDEILGSFIPDVYISKITLSNAGSNGIIDDPHTDSERELESKKLAPDRGQDRPMTISIDLLVKEKYEEDIFSQWFEDKDLTKYVKIRVYQSRDINVTKAMSSAGDMLDLIDPNKTVDFSSLKWKVLASVSGLTTAKDLQGLLQTKTEFREVGLKKDNVGQDIELKRMIEVVDDNGNILKDIGYNVTFNISTSHPEHLAYFAVSYLDVVALAQDNGIDIDTLERGTYSGKIVSDVVINNSQAASTSYTFYDKTGQIWPGPVHLTDNGQWRTQREEKPSSIDLDRISVPNGKLQDFRNIDDIERLSLDFSFIENTLLNQQETKFLTKDRLEPARPQEYFSQMYSTIDRDGDSKFYFIVDYEKLVKDHILFGDLMTPSNAVLSNDIMSRSKIQSMRIIRKRVKTGELSRFGTSKTLSDFDSTLPPELVASSYQRGTTLVKFEDDKASLRESNTTLPREFRAFTGMDKMFGELTDGIYQYGVEIQIDDGSESYIRETINTLIVASNELKNYLLEATTPSMGSYIADNRDPHIDSARETAGTKGKTSGNFDTYTNRFTQYFIKKMKNQYGQSPAAPWIAPVATYLTVLDTFTSALKDYGTKSRFLNTITSYTSPYTGNPNGISKVIDLIENMIVRLESYVGRYETNDQKRATTGAPKDSTGKSLAVKRTFEVVKFFPTVIDSNRIVKGGIDYLSSEGLDNTSNHDGLRTLSSDEYLNRARLETLRFYDDPSPDINMTSNGNNITTNDKISNTELTFLTPVRADFGARSLVTLDGATAKVGSSSKNKVNRIALIPNEGNISKGAVFNEMRASLLGQATTTAPFDVKLNNDIPDSKINNKIGDSQKNQNSINDSLAAVMASNFSTSIVGIPLERTGEGSTNVQPKPIPSLPVAGTAKSNNTFEARQADYSDKTQEKAGINNFMMSFSTPFTKVAKDSLGLPPTPLNTTTEAKISILDGDFSLGKLSISDTGNKEDKIIQGLKDSVTENEVKELPNQLKSLILATGGTSKVKQDKALSVISTTYTEKADATAERELTYDMLVQVEFLSGFYTNRENKKPAILSPIWQKLTTESFNSFVGEEILCRLRKYENLSLGYASSISLPVDTYDEYFILKPNSEVSDLPNVLQESNASFDNILDRLRDVIPGVSFTEVDLPPSPFQTPKTPANDSRDRLNLFEPVIIGGTLISSLPTKLDIIQTDSTGIQKIKAFTLNSNIQVGPPTLGTSVGMTNITLSGLTTITVGSAMLADVMSTDMQLSNQSTEFVTNNTVEQKSLEDIVIEASAEEPKATSPVTFKTTTGRTK